MKLCRVYLHAINTNRIQETINHLQFVCICLHTTGTLVALVLPTLRFFSVPPTARVNDQFVLIRHLHIFYGVNIIS